MFKRKDGLWQEQIKLKGSNKYRYFYGRTKAEVLRKIAEYKENNEKGPLFPAVADEWWEQHQKEIAYNTKKPYIPAIKRANEYFADAYIREIKPPDIYQFLKSFIAENHAAQKTAHTQLGVINMICKYAVVCGYVESNPARDIVLPKNLKKTKRELPDDKNIRRIKQSTDCTFGMFAYWVMYTGCRKGELLALTWDDVDIKNRNIHISKSLYHENNRPVVKKPKSDAGDRFVPLLDALYEKITPGTGLVFQNCDGSHITETQYQRLWQMYRNESGVDCTAHQLRHLFTTMLYEADIAAKDASRILGHADAKITIDTYTHIRKAREKSINDSLLHVDIM